MFSIVPGSVSAAIIFSSLYLAVYLIVSLKYVLATAKKNRGRQEGYRKELPRLAATETISGETLSGQSRLTHLLIENTPTSRLAGIDAKAILLFNSVTEGGEVLTKRYAIQHGARFPWLHAEVAAWNELTKKSTGKVPPVSQAEADENWRESA